MGNKVAYIALNFLTIRDRMKYPNTSDLILLSTANLGIVRSFHQNWWFDLKSPRDLPNTSSPLYFPGRLIRSRWTILAK